MKLVIPKNIEEKIHAYVMSVNSEIAGMGKVRVQDAETVVVEDVMIYEQKVTGATADLSSEAIAKWQSELVRAGGSPKMWKLWWHSHHTMSAFFSGTDTATMDRQTEGDWMMSLVVNTKRQREARLDVYSPFRVIVKDVKIEIEGETDFAVPDAIKREVAEKVKSYTSSTPMGYKTYAPAAPAQAPQGILMGVAFHRHCPMHTTNGKNRQCYYPYGKDKALAFTDCTSKKFKKKYGKHPFSSMGKDDERDSAPIKLLPKSKIDESVEVELDYDRDQIVQIIRTLEKEIQNYDDYGMGHSADCLIVRQELADWYYELSEKTNDDVSADICLAKAHAIESDIYDLSELRKEVGNHKLL